jgi:hypothetical protein
MLSAFRFVLVVAILSVLPRPLLAQVNFSGQWELIEEASPQIADYSSPIGKRGSIVQDAEILTLTSSREGARRFNLDGSDTQHVTMSPAGEPFTANSRVRWTSSALLITTAHTRPSLPNAWEDIITLSLNGQGQLVIIKVSPNLWPYGTTNTHRWVYRKASSVN